MPPIIPAAQYRIDHPLRVGVISNPGSLRNRRGLPAVRRAIDDHPGVLHREAKEPKAVTAALNAFAAGGVELIVFNSGDGTIGLGLGTLLESTPFEKPPLLSLIRGGNTNMDAGDVGQAQQQLKALQRVLAWSQTATTPNSVAQRLRRPVLKVRTGDQGKPHYGMFFGAGAIIRGIEYCHEAVHRRGFVDGLGPGLCTLRVLMALGRGDPRFVTPVPMHIGMQPAFSDGIDNDGEQATLLLLVSSLERLFLGLTPYWGGGDGPLHLTTVRFHPTRPVRTLPGLMRGRTGRYATPDNGYRSGRIDELELLMDGPITLDGEIHHASREQGPVRIVNGGYADFLRVP